MKLEDHTQIVNEILGNLSDQGKVSELLLKLTEDNKTIESSLLDINTKLENTTSDNESLRKANNKLFIQLGSSEPAPPNNPKADESSDQDNIDLTFESLFNDKGELI